MTLNNVIQLVSSILPHFWSVICLPLLCIGLVQACFYVIHYIIKGDW